MAYRKDKTTSANAAVMSAASIVSREDTADVTAEDIGARVVGIAKVIFEGLLSGVVDADNALFEAEETKGTTSTKGTSKKGATPAGEPGEVTFTGGKFKGCTIAEVYSMDEDTAKETYNHQYGDGAAYIKNYVATDKNTIASTREAAKNFLAALGSGA